MSKKQTSFPTFQKWFKKLTRKQKIGLFIGIFALLILPLAVWAAQNRVLLLSSAHGIKGNKIGGPVTMWWYDNNNKGNLREACQSKSFAMNKGFMYEGLQVFDSELKCLTSLLGPRPSINPKHCILNYQCKVGFECKPIEYVTKCTGDKGFDEKCVSLGSIRIDGEKSLGQCTEIPKPCVRKGQTCGKNYKVTSTCCGSSKCNVTDKDRPGKIFCN